MRTKVEELICALKGRGCSTVSALVGGRIVCFYCHAKQKFSIPLKGLISSCADDFAQSDTCFFLEILRLAEIIEREDNEEHESFKERFIRASPGPAPVGSSEYRLERLRQSLETLLNFEQQKGFSGNQDIHMAATLILCLTLEVQRIASDVVVLKNTTIKRSRRPLRRRVVYTRG